MSTKSTISEYKWRRLSKQTGLSKGKMIYLLGCCDNGNDLLSALNIMFQ